MRSREEIFNLSPDELKTKLVELEEEMDNLQLQKATHQLTNPLRIRVVRRNIARMKTLINEYEKGIRVVKAEKEKK
jgi:large subunit ribosomal protein L29